MIFPTPDVHEKGEKVPVPLHMAQAAAWRVAAALIRQHSEDLYVLKLHPSMGQSHQLTLFLREGSSLGRPGSIIRMGMTRGGRINGRSREEKDYTRFHWLDVLLAQDLQEEVIKVLQDGEGLPSSSVNPPLNNKSIGAQVVATALAMHAMSSRPLVANNGVYDSSGMGGSAVCTEYFHTFDSMIDEIAGYDDEESLDDHPAYRFWFVCNISHDHGSPPLLGVDSWNGYVWTNSVTKGNLVEMYESCGQDINLLTASLLHIPAN
jgi:hypothetical protein